jgi:hypothetical protein
MTGRACIGAIGFAAALCAQAATRPRVYIENNEVFVDAGAGRPAKRLTSDTAPKSGVALSPSGSLIFYMAGCIGQAQTCPPQIAVVDMEGRRLASFPVMRTDGACLSFNTVEWIDDARIGVECHINPSLSEYVELDARSGREGGEWLGYWFTWSPDRKQIAHVGWIIHFAPPSAQSNYLQFGARTVYPKVAPSSPAAAPAMPPDPPDVVRFRDGVALGIHEFYLPIRWSPDSRRVALFERIYDWKPDKPDSNAGETRNERYRLVVAAADSDPLEWPTPAAKARLWIESMAAQDAFDIAWRDAGTFEVSTGHGTWTFVVLGREIRLTGSR